MNLGFICVSEFLQYFKFPFLKRCVLSLRRDGVFLLNLFRKFGKIKLCQASRLRGDYNPLSFYSPDRCIFIFFSVRRCEVVR